MLALASLLPRNDLGRVVGADADYRADIEAGVTLGSVWHLLVARTAHQVLAGSLLTIASKQ